MKTRLITTIFSVALLAPDFTAIASEVLKHNPFEQPYMADGNRASSGNTAVASGMELRGTLIDGPDSMANIDGEYYRLNHEVSGYRIVRIESGSVTLTRAGNETVLTLRDDE